MTNTNPKLAAELTETFNVMMEAEETVMRKLRGETAEQADARRHAEITAEAQHQAEQRAENRAGQNMSEIEEN